MSVTIQKLVKAVTLTFANNFGLENFALYQRPGGPDAPEPPDGAGAAGGHLGGVLPIRWSSGGPDEAIDTPTTLLPSLQGQIQHHTSAM